MKKSKKTISFKCEYELDKKTFLEFWGSEVFNKETFILINILSFGILGILIVLKEFFLLAFLASLISVSILLFYLLFRTKYLIKYKKLNSLKYSITIKNEKITIKNGDVKYNLPLKEIENIKITPNLFVISITSRMRVILKKYNIKGGTIEELITYIFNHASNLNKRKLSKTNYLWFKSISGSMLIFLLALILNFDTNNFKNNLNKNNYKITNNIKYLKTFTIKDSNDTYIGDVYEFKNKSDALDYYLKTLEIFESDAESLECSQVNNYYKCYIRNFYDIAIIRNEKYIFVSIAKENLEETLKNIDYFK